jgi:hypoxanthine-DNA glycosylase
VLKIGLAPVIDTRARILILGTLPGEESLRLQRYYGHPRNLFWRILFDVFGETYESDYERQKALLKRHRIGLWDVLHSAERIGSLDSAIRNPIPNDIAGLLADYPGLEAIAFNGQRAHALFREHIVRHLGGLEARLSLAVLPSTSPTPSRKSLSYDEKVASWSRTLTAVEVGGPVKE